MTARTSRTLAWLATAAWAALIFYMSSRPGNTLPGGFSVQAHFIEYAILAALLVWALAGGRSWVVALLLAVVLASLYGITDEFHQRFVPMRVPDVADWLTDTLGAFAGAAITSLALRSTTHPPKPRGDDKTP